VSEVLVSQSSDPGELVVDPFMGSGSVGEAALKLGRRFRGNDISRTAVSVASERLAKWGVPERAGDESAVLRATLLGLMGSEA
jgi:site-specific DNA-methyltransferase (adenine-specific)